MLLFLVRHLCVIEVVVAWSLSWNHIIWLWIMMPFFFISLMLDYLLNHTIQRISRLVLLKSILPIALLCGYLIEWGLGKNSKGNIFLGLLYCSYMLMLISSQGRPCFSKRRIVLAVLFGTVPIMNYIFISIQFPLANLGFAGMALYFLFYIFLLFYLLSYGMICGGIFSVANGIALWLIYYICGGNDPFFNLFLLGVIFLTILNLFIACLIPILKTVKAQWDRIIGVEKRD